MMINKQILFTGGGSAGHVTPNLALIEALQQDDWQIAYIGSKQGVERDIVNQSKIPYYPISAGKLRRYFSWQNFLDPFKTLLGIAQSFMYCLRLKPKVVFSKGGYVAFPVVLAAYLLRIPVIAHESDLTPGLANRLSYFFSTKILLSFSESEKYFKPSQKIIFTGTPIRPGLLSGSAEQGRMLCGFDAYKPILLVLGGGLGSALINRVIEENLDRILIEYQVIHLCGQQEKNAHSPRSGYFRFPYVHEEMNDLYAVADLVISRAGANTIWELIALKKPHLLIPLGSQASRGDQIMNAQYFEAQGISMVLTEDGLNGESMLKSLQKLRQNSDLLRTKMQERNLSEATNLIKDQIYKILS